MKPDPGLRTRYHGTFLPGFAPVVSNPGWVLPSPPPVLQHAFRAAAHPPHFPCSQEEEKFRCVRGTWEYQISHGSRFFNGTTELEFTGRSDNYGNADWKGQGPEPKQGGVTRQGTEQGSGILEKELARPRDNRE